VVFLLALAVGLVLADSSVVTLALPDILRDLETSVGTVAWVLISFNLALALAALPGSRLTRGRARAAFSVALVAFALASAACAAAASMELLIAARVAQGIFGAVVVAAALELLVARVGSRHAVRLWAAAGVLGAALGPAAGGFLTEAFSWQAMFALQAPVALLALAGARAAPAASRAGTTEPPSPAPVAAESAGAARAQPPVVALLALALVSAALAAALFLLVVLLIEGWRHSPGEAALTVTVMPVAALLAGRWERAHVHGLGAALAGCLLIAGGLASLGLLPGAGPAWTLAPQLAIGAGLGLALAALIGVAVGGADGAREPGRPAAWTIAARHAGIVAGLLILTPIFTADLNEARLPAVRAGLAQLLDAPLSLDAKIDLARTLGPLVEQADDELPDLSRGFDAVDVPAGERPALVRLQSDLDEQIDRAGTDAFSRSFLAAALLALLAAGVIALAARRPHAARAPDGGAASNGSRLAPRAPLRVGAAAAAAGAALLVAVYVALGGGDYKPAAVAGPCAQRERASGLGDTQLAALATLDGAACRLRTSRETLLLALLDGKLPPGVDQARLSDALRAGVDRARDEDALGALEATALRLAISTRGPAAIIGLFLGR
jgi:predicted MFS family arabinose efflux permease